MPSNPIEEGGHFGSVADAGCILQHSWRHDLWHYTWRHQDNLRAVLPDDSPRISHLEDPTEMFLPCGHAERRIVTASSLKVPGPEAQEQPITFNRLRNIQHGPVVNRSLPSIKLCS